MKVVRGNGKAQLSKTELLKEAKEAGEAEDWKTAVSLYQQVLDLDIHNETAYNRLAIIYRKQKELKKEWQLLNKAIGTFKKMYDSATRLKRNKKISHLSNSFLRLTGLADKKGKPVYQPGPLTKWERRKSILEKTLKKGQGS